MLFMSCVRRAFESVHCCMIVVTCWEKADLLALVCDVCVFVTFLSGILGQVWYSIVLIPDLCHLFLLLICVWQSALFEIASIYILQISCIH